MAVVVDGAVRVAGTDTVVCSGIIFSFWSVLSTVFSWIYEPSSLTLPVDQFDTGSQGVWLSMPWQGWLMEEPVPVGRVFSHGKDCGEELG